MKEIKNFVSSITSKVDESWKIARKDKTTNNFGIAGGDGLIFWENKLLRFGNQLASICYSCNITWDELKERFPEVFSFKYHYNTIKGSDWVSFDDFLLNNFKNCNEEIIVEILDKKWNFDAYLSPELENGNFTPYCRQLNIDDQLTFIKSNMRRVPIKVLDIGGGRGEIANSFQYLRIPCTSVDPGLYTSLLHEATGKHFFGEDFEYVIPRNEDLKSFCKVNNLNEFDTIIFCESIEHISEKDFWNFWDNVKRNFKGMVIVTNTLDFHPIPLSPPQHIFEITDKVYDKLSTIGICKFRKKSHLVLEI